MRSYREPSQNRGLFSTILDRIDTWKKKCRPTTTCAA